MPTKVLSLKTKKDVKNTNLVVPIESELKLKVKKILEELGLNQSQIVLALFKEIARTQKIPLSFDLKDEWRDARYANKEEEKVLKEFLANPQLIGVKESEKFIESLKKSLDD